jgi:chromosome segregation ATPase
MSMSTTAKPLPPPTATFCDGDRLSPCKVCGADALLISQDAELAALRAECSQAKERADFLHAATREAQEYAAKYADEVMALRAEFERLRQDAARYQWLRNESWAGYNQSKRRPMVAENIVFVADGAGNVKTILAGDALDAAIDAALTPTERTP